MKRFLPIRLKAAELSDAGEFCGYLSTTEVDLCGDRMAPGCWRESLASGGHVGMLWAHRMDEPVGGWVELREDSAGLYARGRLSLDIPRAREAHGLMKVGGAALSAGFNFNLDDAEWDPSTSTQIIHRATLIEGSVVACPANRSARITEVKSLATRPEFEAYFKSLGFANRMAKKLAATAAGDIDLPAHKSEPELDWDALALRLAASPLLDR